MKIVFATNNKHKLDEIRNILGEKFEVLSLNDIDCHDDIPETGYTLEENARQKAEYIYNKYHCNVFADDTGLDAESHDSEANMTTLLRELEGKGNRKARFRTVICLILTPHSHFTLFEGIVEGEIIPERRGGEGFGYDPIFQPEGYDKTFAELGNEIKNTISHRARAVAKLSNYIKTL